MFNLIERNDVPISFENEFSNFKKYVNDISKEKLLKVDKKEYVNLPFSFDIETSSFYDENKEKKATRYAFVIGVKDRVYVGRTWLQFEEYINYLIKTFNTNSKRILTIYVHNLSYEFQWIEHLFDWKTIFALSSREVCYCLSKSGIVFRCSYLLSGYSLAKVGEHLNKYKVSKKVGDLDYHLLRGSNTPLTEKEWGYIYNDGLVVLAYIQEEIERNKNKITNLPLTKTGYVRRYMRQCCLYSSDGRHVYKNHKYGDYKALMSTLTLTKDEYESAKDAFMGGFTHANAFNCSKIIEDVTSEDFTSSYPATRVREEYPMSNGVLYQIKDMNDFRRLDNIYLMILYVKFYNVESLNKGDDIISFSTCLDVKNEVLNNGRISTADEITRCITNIDFKSILKFYSIEKIEFGDAYIYRRDYLPKDYVLGVLKLYKDKTTLKGVQGKEIEYMNSKEQLNSCYGMTVTDICRPIIQLIDGQWAASLPDIEKDIKKYNKDPSRFLSYLWGVFVTAYARRNLYQAILELGDDYIYADTDSVKFVNYEKHKRFFDNYNEENERLLMFAMEYQGIPYDYIKPKTIQGKTKVIGNWDFDGHYKYFKTLGAKRYICVDDNNEVHITIAGVAKKAGALYLQRKYKTPLEILKNFNNQLIFPALYNYNGEEVEGAGKQILTYIDEATDGDFIDYLGNTCHYTEQSSIFMESTSYSLSMTQDYLWFIMNIQEFKNHYET